MADLYDVIIVGCGPVGATVANLLGQYGLRVLVLEKETEIHPLPRAIHCDDETMRIFQACGFRTQLSAQTRPIQGMHLLDRHQRLLLAVQKSADHLPRYGFPAANVFHQPMLEAMLRHGLEQYPSIEFRPGWALTSFSQHADSVIVTVCESSGQRSLVRGRYLLGCDGAGSLVRRLAGLLLSDLRMDQSWLVVDTKLRADASAPAVVQQICDPARPATCVPGFGDRCRWEFMLLPGETAEWLCSPQQVQILLSRFVDPGAVTIERTAVYTFHALLAEHWRSGRVLILGDAAHQMPPFLGQGMCAGIRDAHNLAWKLWMVLTLGVDDALLNSYQQERRPHVAAVLRLVRLAGGLIQTRNRGVATLRDALLRGAMALPPVRQRLRQLESTIPDLHNGCLALDNRVAGKLLPQPWVQTAAGEVLLDELLGPGFTIITLGESSPSPSFYSSRLPIKHVHMLPPGSAHIPAQTPHAVVDKSRLLTAWCAQAGVNLLVVRPDRYIFGGYSSTEGSTVINQLEAMLPPGL